MGIVVTSVLLRFEGDNRRNDPDTISELVSGSGMHGLPRQTYLLIGRLLLCDLNSNTDYS